MGKSTIDTYGQKPMNIHMQTEVDELLYKAYRRSLSTIQTLV